jgi:hypothetical protein
MDEFSTTLTQKKSQKTRCEPDERAHHQPINIGNGEDGL